MKRKLLGVFSLAYILFLLAAQLSSAPAYGAPAPGVLRGTTLDANGLAAPQVVVTVHSVDENTDRFAISDAKGNFVVASLAPGPYLLKASKPGFTSSRISFLAVGSGDDLRLDLRLGETGAGAAVTESSDPANAAGTANPADPAAAAAPAPAAAATPAVPPAVTAELAAMEKRIDELESALNARDAAVPTPAQPAPMAVASAMPMANGSSWSSSSASATVSTASPDQTAKPAPAEPFSKDDWTWLNGNSRNHDDPLAMKYFDPEIRFDTNYIEDYNQPKDHTMGGSTESFRSSEVQLEQMSFGGDLRVGNVRGRILTMFGLFATTTPRNDGSAGVGQWNLDDAYKYFSEAWGGYHFNVNHGLNIDAGIFVSYIGLFSYYNYDNWAYQPSFVSSNTPWFFNGVRVQWFPKENLKIEPWFINGWQSYARFNGHPGLGGQILWRPKPWISVVANNYGMGTDTLGNPGRSRIHTDDSVEIRTLNHPDNFLDSMAMSVTGDLGCEYGGGVSCHGDTKNGPKQSFAGWMLYERFQFKHDHYGLTLGGGAMDNPGRYLVLLPPINGATAVSGSPYFPAFPGSKYKAWDSTVTLDWMPSQFATFRFETGYRYASVPYWTGRGGITPPGGNVGPVATNGSVGTGGSYLCTNGTTSVVSTFSPGAEGIDTPGDLAGLTSNCAGIGMSPYLPDLRKGQWENTIALMVKL
jgi:hypothetical protein